MKDYAFESLICVYCSWAGKTVYVKNVLSYGINQSVYRKIMITFSAQTNANETQVQLIIILKAVTAYAFNGVANVKKV